MNYYNEYDPHAAAWLKNLIRCGLIPPGVVDQRPIQEVTPDDLVGFTQCHFFAGVGGWSLALKIAGWSPQKPVWTGSCPCQPFSVAGRGLGTDDPRHLWPHFRRLIADGGPAVVFGEQVASKDGRGWLAGVRADLEVLGYAVGSADLCAAGVGAPHIRQRLWWVADSGLADTAGCVVDGRTNEPRRSAEGRTTDWWNCSRGMADARGAGLGELRGTVAVRTEQPCTQLPSRHSWGDHWIPCDDGKARRIKPGLAPLVDGLPGRVGLVRGYGNAIVPAVGAEFIRGFSG